MKAKIIVLLLLTGVGLGPLAWAKAIEPTPLTVVTYKGEEIPVYDVKDVRPKSFEQPRYPDEARDLRAEGQAIIVVVVDTSGKVIEADIKESKPTAAFGVAAQKAVRQWRYPKLTRNGQPTKFILQQVIMFEIQ